MRSLELEGRVLNRRDEAGGRAKTLLRFSPSVCRERKLPLPAAPCPSSLLEKCSISPCRTASSPAVLPPLPFPS